jgi:hypothetical protein
MPTLSADNNGSYGGSLINEKYSPLRSITIAAGDKDFYVNLFDERIKTLTRQNIFPTKLTLITSGLPAPDTFTSTPIVVISSNRAEWMKSLFDNADTKNRKARITGYNDPATFSEGIIPWYAPWRSQKILYIVVHSAEYGYYKKLLAGYVNVYVVGWQFPATAGGLGPAGFGASRFAALELIKYLKYQRAWAVDDNVVNINGFPNTAATIEGLMTADFAGIGFSAATNNDVLVNVYKDSTFTTLDFDFSKQKAGLLQQVVLWNVDYLKSRNLTFSPYFVTSNEDVSLSNYLQAFNYTQRIIKGLSIIKMQPTNDTKNQGALQLAGIRTRFQKLLYNLEKNTQISINGTKAKNLSEVVTETILPNAQNKGGGLNVRKKQAYERTTQSMAIEQVLAESVSKKWAPPKTFNPYVEFAAGTMVEQRAG